MEPSRFEPYRDFSFKFLLQHAFQALPARINEILERERWKRFTDFMAAVERSGRLLAQYEGKPKAKIIQERGLDAAMKEMYDLANTEAMNQLLSGAFFGEQGGSPDLQLSVEALARVGVGVWGDIPKMVFVASQEGMYVQTGKDVFDFASADTLLFLGFISQKDQTPEVVLKLTKTFGLSSPRHLIALTYACASAELTPEDLDRSQGDFPKLTELVNRCPSNPYKGIVFSEVENPRPIL